MYELIVTHQQLSGMCERTEAQSINLALVRRVEEYWQEAPRTLMTRIEKDGIVILPDE